MKITEADLIWSQSQGTFRVERRGSNWERGKDEAWMHADNGKDGLIGLLALFNMMVVYYSLDPHDLHQALLVIDEYHALALEWEQKPSYWTGDDE